MAVPAKVKEVEPQDISEIISSYAIWCFIISSRIYFFLCTHLLSAKTIYDLCQTGNMVNKTEHQMFMINFHLIIGPRGRGITETWHGYVTTLAHPYFNYESAPCSSCQWPILRVPAVGRLHRLGTLPIVQGRANN